MTRKLRYSDFRDLAISAARRNDIDVNENNTWHFTGPRRGPGFDAGPFTLHIPKNPIFAPYIAELDFAAANYDLYNHSDQIGVINTSQEFGLMFTPQQFSSAFCGFYRFSDLMSSLDSFVDSEIDDYSLGVLNILKRIPQSFIPMAYMSDYLSSGRCTRNLIGCGDEVEAVAGEIPLKYKKQRHAKIPVRRATELRYTVFPKEVHRVFPLRSARVIFLQGYKGRDCLPEDFAGLSVFGKTPTLTPYGDSYRDTRPEVFEGGPLWLRYGSRIVTAYSVINLPPEGIVKEHLDSEAYAIFNLLKGRSE